MELFRPTLLAHELGHGMLHRQIAMMSGFQELEVLMKRADRPMEYEANLFAAELLLEDKTVLQVLWLYQIECQSMRIPAYRIFSLLSIHHPVQSHYQVQCLKDIPKNFLYLSFNLIYPAHSASHKSFMDFSIWNPNIGILYSVIKLIKNNLELLLFSWHSFVT